MNQDQVKFVNDLCESIRVGMMDRLEHSDQYTTAKRLVVSVNEANLVDFLGELLENGEFVIRVKSHQGSLKSMESEQEASSVYTC